MKKILNMMLTVAFLGILITGCAAQQTSSAEYVSRSLDVSGIGTVKVEPDLAVVNIGVRSQFADVAEALKDNSAKAEAIRQVLIDMGIAEKDIQTRNFNVYPQEDFNPVPETETRTFVVENTVSTVVRDLNRLGEILAAVVQESANTIHGVQFDVEDRDAAIEEARQIAIDDAMAKAKAIAEEAGVNLGAIQSISVNEGGGIGPVVKAEAAAEMPQGGAVPIAGGTLTVQVTAHLTYSIN